MKPATRRLGRGLGAFLDFGPAGNDGSAHVSEALDSPEATSILETSAPRPKPAPAAPPVPTVLTRPAGAPRPASPIQTKPVPPKPAAPPAPPPAPPSPVSPGSDEALFIDDEVVGLAFPDVELE